MNNVLETYDKWNKRISTGKLNNWLRSFEKIKKLPTELSNKLNIKYIMQTKVRPPSFIIVVNNESLMKKYYLTFLRRKLAE